MKIEKSFKIIPPSGSHFITEAFGIEAGYENKILCDIDMPEVLPSIVYITGESGCGKSTLLKEMNLMTKQVEIPSEPLFKWVEDEDKALSLLTLVGLGDATMFISTYNILSDSQKARARIYLDLLSDKDIIVIDEFLSTLDRATAKSVSFCLQKAIRSQNKTLIAVTAHSDLEEYLQPDFMLVGKGFPSRWISKDKREFFNNPFTERVTFRYDAKEWYRKCRLGELHYKGKYTGGTKEYLVMSLNGEDIGFIVSTYRMQDGGRRISRFVVHPSYRGVGLGTLLVKTYLKDYPTADVVSVMGTYNPVFEKSGMIKLPDIKTKVDRKLLTLLEANGFMRNNWHSKSYCGTMAELYPIREALASISKNVSYLVCPGGKYLKDDEVKEKILNNPTLAGRVLWNIRPKTMAKYIGKI